LCKQAITKGGIYPAAANAANEAANELFRQGKIGFLDIADMVSYALENTAFSDCDSLEKILLVDSESRKMVYSHLR
ncbi:MAG: 1-deoxy-D-xylulose-5-phosphate reductoisomerase, partial [Acutalibacteraceae bacterium]